MFSITATTDKESGLCPVRNVLNNVSGKWCLLILFSLEDGPLRFSAIKRTVGDITQRVLTENLRSLERDGYIVRTVEPGPPIAVFYELTSLGLELIEIYRPLVLWAADRFDEIMRSRKNYDRRKQG